MMRVLKLGASLAMMALLLWWADAGVVAQRLQEADPVWLGLALLSLTALTFLMAKRWQIVTVALEMELPYSRALKEYYVGQLVNLVLPGGVAGDIGRAIRTRHEADLTRAAQSVAAERFLGQAALFALMGFAFACTLLLPGGIAWPSYVWLGIAALLVAAAALVLLARRQHATGRFLRVILALMCNTRLIILGVLITALLIFSLYACALATGTHIPISAVFTLIPLILSAMLIPLSVGGWGWREGAAAALFPLIGASPSAGIAMGIAYGAMMTIAALPAVFFLARPSETKSFHTTQNGGLYDTSHPS
ncbi:MAG: lysylphosphatidylglycerol synthase transmembrane domain-containing protein [Litoreibacter sp.]|nr:lysylphosphatidylglycerol synthase transmembrane domain-containing protein [Litoreibacter sp.]